jgi:hypothetical protein
MQSFKSYRKPLVVSFILILMLLVGVVGPGLAHANPGWYSGGWLYRKKITINAANVTATLTNFPVLVSITSDAALGSHTQIDGDDILFTAADETTKLSHEIEKFSSNGVTANLTAWVKIPSLSSITNTDIYMYYGNAGAANQQSAASVWDSNYKMVQHMEESAGGANSIKDSTVNGNDGTDNNTPTFEAAGKADGAISFDGVNELIRFGFGNSINITRPLTIETWIKPVTVPSGSSSKPILFRDNGTNMNYSLSIASGTYTGNTGVKVLFWREDVLDSDNKTYGTTEIAAGNWYRIAVVDEGTQGVAGNFKIYVNGANAEGVLSANLTAFDGATHKLVIADTSGERIGGGSFFNGTIDEVRISNTARSADWLKTGYNNQNDPSGFISLGAEQALQAPTVVTDNATLVEETTATLNGVLTGDGGEPCQYSFEWGTASGIYTDNISWTGSVNTGQSFNTNLSSLTKGQPYYFRARVKNSTGVVNGGELHFLTKPDAPVSLSATANSSSQIDLLWVKGTGAQRTMVRGKSGDYPASISDGYEVYFNTGTSTSDTGLFSNTTYFYRAWSEVTGSQQWSDSFVSANATTNAGPSVLSVGGVVLPVNKTSVLAPWIFAALVLSLTSIRLIVRFRK